MGNEASADEESFADGLLEYPQYTRPADFRGLGRARGAALAATTAGSPAGGGPRPWPARSTAGPTCIEARGGLTEDERGRSGRSSAGDRRILTPVAPRDAYEEPPRHEPHRSRRPRRSLRDDIPDFAPGDTLKVHVRVVEGTRERVQVFQGVVIRRQGSGVRETFTVRKVSFGVGVERTFPVHSPIVAKIEVVTRGDVRRAKLYYLRDRTGKAAKIKEKRTAR